MSTPLADPLRELLRATGLGDRIAFAELYRLTSGKLYATANRCPRGQRFSVVLAADPRWRVADLRAYGSISRLAYS